VTDIDTKPGVLLDDYQSKLIFYLSLA